MINKIFGLLEYSYTKGYNDKNIINFYLDHRLQTQSHIRFGDRVAIIYDYTSDEGMIFKVKSDLPDDISKTDYPKMFYSSNNKLGKIKVWYELDREYYNYLMLPPEVAGEQIKLDVLEVKDGFIKFRAGSKRSHEEVAIVILTNALHVVNNPDSVKLLINQLKSGVKLEDINKKD